MKLIKISKWFENKCGVNLSKTQIIRLNHLGKKGVLINDTWTTHSIDLYYKDIYLLKLEGADALREQ